MKIHDNYMKEKKFFFFIQSKKNLIQEYKSDSDFQNWLFFCNFPSD
jgi:hypothetical protein